MLVVRYALKLFSGTGRLSQSWRAHSQRPIIEIDLKWGDTHDLMQPCL